MKDSFTRKTILALSRERESRKLRHIYDYIISPENLLLSWKEFLSGKCKKHDVARFSFYLAHNVLSLHTELFEKKYVHGAYDHFRINDPKARDIHKSSVKDRLLHHALYRVLYPFFDTKFIYDSYSCRKNKGTHKAVYRFKEMARTVSRNDTRNCWVLKCDIRKFFASIDHAILKCVLEKHIHDADLLWLLGQVIDSFHTQDRKGVGLPLGNLTSQLLVNVYMNQFDQYMKHQLKIKYYIRYADDFVVLSESREYLEILLFKISVFLQTRLHLSLHPDKVFIKTLASGVDFLGWVHFPHHRVLRTATKRRMVRNLKKNQKPETIASYKGMLLHGNTHKLQKRAGLVIE